MLGSLRGEILAIHPPAVLLEVQDVGYEVVMGAIALASVQVGQSALIYIHDHVREDAHDLYGFLTLDEKYFFEKLLSVSGVGPKAALNILSIGPLETVRRAVLGGDLATLTSVPGVGLKTAQKVVLELKGQLVDEVGVSGVDKETVEALVALGYSASQARSALKHLDPSMQDASERIRQALKILAS